MRRITSLQPGDVIWIAFPHVESNQIGSRPALIVSTTTLGPKRQLAWAMMITNAERTGWPGDVPIADHQALGLPIASKIRTEKVATLDISEAKLLGKLPEVEFNRVKQLVRSYLGVR